MKIQSKFKDYYDYGAAYGVDTTIFYLRETAEIKAGVRYGAKHHQVKHNPALKAFFDLLPEYRFNKYGRFNGTFADKVFSYNYRYDPKSIQHHITDHLGYIIIGALVVPYYYEYVYNKEHPNKSYNAYYYDATKAAKRLKSYDYHKVLEHFNRTFDSMVLIKEFKAPVIAIGYDQIVLNPVLFPYGIQDTINATRAFSEVDQALGIINTKEDLVEIADSDKLGQKGFDKQSFKKRKAK